jgi:hypothetical protein
VVITGHDADVRRRLQALPVPERHRVHVRGFTEQMDELMAAADLLVTKPGGLTVSEALARGVGMVLVHPVPGQEERNSDFLLENGAAIKVNHIPTLAHKVTGLLTDAPRLQQIKRSARWLGRPCAAFAIVERCLKLVEEWKRKGNGDGRGIDYRWRGTGRVAGALAAFRPGTSCTCSLGSGTAVRRDHRRPYRQPGPPL